MYFNLVVQVLKDIVKETYFLSMLKTNKFPKFY